MKPDKPHSEQIGISATRAEKTFICGWLTTRQRTMVLLSEARRMKELDAASRDEQAEQHA